MRTWGAETTTKKRRPMLLLHRGGDAKHAMKKYLGRLGSSRKIPCSSINYLARPEVNRSGEDGGATKNLTGSSDLKWGGGEVGGVVKETKAENYKRRDSGVASWPKPGGRGRGRKISKVHCQERGKKPRRKLKGEVCSVFHEEGSRKREKTCSGHTLRVNQSRS